MRRFTLTLMTGAVLALALVVPSNEPLRAQNRLVAQDSGHAALGLALRRLSTAATFLQTTAHPDDENNGLFAWLSRGQGMRAVLFTMTRGNGGQNEIGPELFEDLAVVRTAELEAVHRYDGGEQYFARAVDFGYSFSVEETFRKWGKDEILGDAVRMIRTIRPDVITAMPPGGAGGGQHHQATALLTQEAFRAAADPTKYPDQIKEGLRPWAAKKLYFMAGFGGFMLPPPGMKVVNVDPNVYDPLLGRTYADIGAEARTMHKCQGAGQFLSFPGFSAAAQYRLADTIIPGEMDKTEAGLFDGIDTTLGALVSMAGPNPPPSLAAGVTAIADQAIRAQKAFASEGDNATIPAIVAGLAAVRSLRASLPSMGLSDAARYDIESRLVTKQKDFETAALLAAGVSLDAMSDDGLVYGGQPLKVTVVAVNRGPSSVEVAEVQLDGFTGSGTCKPATLAAGAVYTCASDVNVPPGAKLTAPYWKSMPDASRSIFEPEVAFGVPFSPTPFKATVRLKVADTKITTTAPVQYRYNTDIFAGEKRMELHVVPTFAVRVNPETAIVPAPAKAAVSSAKPAQGLVRTVFVTVINGTKAQASGSVSLKAPDGWQVVPASAPVSFSHEDEALTVRFNVKMPAAIAPGDYTLKATVTSPAAPGQVFDEGYQVVEYPHIQRHHVLHAAASVFKVQSVKTTPNVNVGYIMGVGDVVPDALEQIGAKVTLINSDELAWGDLSKYQVIFTGIRAYERRQDLRAHNRRLLDYAEAGGTVIVQYNKMEFNDAQFGPYPARVSSSRATDENAPVMVLVPNNPVFNLPNKVTEASWKGWVQERGLYFLGGKDDRYVDLLQIDEPFEYNKGLKKGALVEASVGKGRWLYLGLGLWRQVMYGTPGAYELLANMVNLGKVPVSAAELMPVKK
jgi:LmbE family N-acetylglucosaminyl deacetylase